jgi:adenylylsulfate kinase-like enzyme
MKATKLYWFTGQAGAGKTELANALKTKMIREQTIERQNYVSSNGLWKVHNFYERSKKFVIIDGDDIRELYKNTDYSIEGRKANVDFVQKLCTFLIKNEITPIVCMVSPFAHQRKEFIKQNDGIEIYVYCNEIRGRENYHVDYYEKPLQSQNTIEIDTTGKTPLQSLEELWKNL